MKPFMIALLCAVAIVAAHGRSLRQAESSQVAPAPAAAGNRTFASSIEAANVTANVSDFIAIIDGAYDGGLYDNLQRIPLTTLVPTNDAFEAALKPTGLNATTLKQLIPRHLQLVLASLRAFVAYHTFPNRTLTTANLTDGLSLPTNFDEAGNLTVHVDPTTKNISFSGFVNSIDAAAANTTSSTNSAAVLFPNIRVKGLDGVVLHVVDKVLEPPRELLEMVLTGLVTAYNQAIAAEQGVVLIPTALVAGSSPANATAPSEGAGANTTAP